MKEYKEQKLWEEKFRKDYQTIIKKNYEYMLDAEPASFERDTKEATDFVITVKDKGGGDGAIACRARRHFYFHYLDLTIRTKSLGGMETEIHKIKRGYADWYIYAWINEEETYIKEWVLLDLNKVRDRKILDMTTVDDKRISRDKPNGDGTWFRPIHMSLLNEYGCIVSKSKGIIFTKEQKTKESVYPTKKKEGN